MNKHVVMGIGSGAGPVSDDGPPLPADVVARQDLAAAYRLAVRVDLHEGIENHFSVRDPQDARRFYIHAYGLHFDEVTASRLLHVEGGEEGRLLSGEGTVELSAFALHWAVYEARPDVSSVMHTHMRYATALCNSEPGRLEMFGHNAVRFYGRIAYEAAYGGAYLDLAEGRRMVRLLGDKSVLFLKNHGVLVTGGSVAAAFHDLYFLERACHDQLLARQSGERPALLGDNIAGESVRFFEDELDTYKALHFAALRRLLDRDRSDYAT
jgi:ribulose-5-phosphate 4-epimerase/fuculose-1-phosphate aldolase